MHARTLFVFFAVISLAADVAADTVSAPPTFVSLDRASGRTSAGVDFGVQFNDDSNSDGGISDVVGSRLDLFGEHTFTPRIGVTATLPLIWINTNIDDHMGLGSIHVAGYHRFDAGGSTTIVARLGAQLPTQTFIPERGYEPGVARRGAIFQRLEEPADDGGDVWLRAGATARVARGPFAAQIDLLTDFTTDSAFWDAADGFPVRATLGFGASYSVGRLGFTAELVASGFPFARVDPFFGDSDASSLGERTVVAATGSVRVDAGPVDAMIWFTNPLDEYIRNHFHVFGVGVRSAL